jgi:hypothetical protein
MKTAAERNSIAVGKKSKKPRVLQENDKRAAGGQQPIDLWPAFCFKGDRNQNVNVNHGAVPGHGKGHRTCVGAAPFDLP